MNFNDTHFILIPKSEYDKMIKIIREKNDILIQLDLIFRDYSDFRNESFRIIHRKISDNETFDKKQLNEITDKVNCSFKNIIDKYERQLFKKEKEIENLKSNSFINRLKNGFKK